jgi:hypothetical protein
MNPDLILLLISIIVLAYLFNHNVEFFNDVTFDEYIGDIKVMAAFVGPYVGDVYSYLRTRVKSSPPMYIPSSLSENDGDHLLKLARHEIKQWIDSSRANIELKYSPEFLAKYRTQWDLFYKESNDGLIVSYRSNGDTKLFPV